MIKYTCRCGSIFECSDITDINERNQYDYFFNLHKKCIDSHTFYGELDSLKKLEAHKRHIKMIKFFDNKK